MTSVVLISPAEGSCVKCNATTRRLEKHGIKFDVHKISETDPEREFWIGLGVQAFPIVVVKDAPDMEMWLQVLKCRTASYEGEDVLYWNDLRYDTVDLLARLVESQN